LWLRRIFDEAMTAAHGTDYWTQVDPKGNRIISKRVADPIISRSSHDPTRYPRIVDAALFEDLISIIWVLRRSPWVKL
jgi:hypothetical protein